MNFYCSTQGVLFCLYLLIFMCISQNVQNKFYFEKLAQHPSLQFGDQNINEGIIFLNHCSNFLDEMRRKQPQRKIQKDLNINKGLCVCMHAWGEVQKHAGVLAFHHESSENRTLVFRLSKKHLYLQVSSGLNL